MTKNEDETRNNNFLTKSHPINLTFFSESFVSKDMTRISSCDSSKFGEKSDIEEGDSSKLSFVTRKLW